MHTALNAFEFDGHDDHKKNKNKKITIVYLRS